jgi:hypothetical protein
MGRRMAPNEQPLDSADEQLLSPVEAARRLRLQPRTLKAWRLRQQGPPYIVVSRQCVRYRARDLNTWVAAHRVAHETAHGDGR